MDPVESVDDVGQPVRRHRIHAFDILEAQVIPDEPDLLSRFYGVGSIQHKRHHELLRKPNSYTGAHLHVGDLRRTFAVCMPNEIRLYKLLVYHHML